MSDKLDIVYLFGYGPNDGAYLDTLLPLVRNQSQKGSNVGFIFIHNGAIIASARKKTNAQVKELIGLPIKMYVLEPDLKARGITLDRINNNIKPIKYGDLVDILDSSEKIISWM